MRLDNGSYLDQTKRYKSPTRQLAHKIKSLLDFQFYAV